MDSDNGSSQKVRLEIAKISLACKHPTTGEILPVDFEATDTIASVKAKIKDTYRLNVQLNFAGTPLEDSVTVDDLFDLMKQHGGQQELQQQPRGQRGIAEINKLKLVAKDPTTGESYPIDMEASDTVGSVKAKIKATYGFDYQLRFAGKQLEDNLTLDDLYRLYMHVGAEAQPESSRSRSSRSRSRTPQPARSSTSMAAGPSDANP